jgi:DNA-directed RNA polymerase subunit RPC12/RpoP
MSTACPKCGSRYLRPSRTRDLSEQMAQLRLVSPFRCLDCKVRFFAATIVWADLSYARCPRCHRMDLNGWTGKTYTNPPFWVAFKVALGARKLRCEYCRFNFASFRRRKEVFTFKRWKKFVPQAEEHPTQEPENRDKTFRASA